MTSDTAHVADLVDDYLHDLLPRDRAAHVERHCAGCADCARALGEARRRHGALRALPPAEPSGRLIQTTLARVEGYERRRRRLRARVGWGAGLAAAAAVLALVGLHLYYFNLKPTNYDLLVLGQKQLLAATTASLRVRLVDRASQMAVPGVPVVVELRHPDGRSVELATATTDADGAAAPRFTLPDWPDGDYQLHVRAATGRRQEVLRQDVRLARSWKLMLGSDKPVYKPGQTVRLRALALRRPDLKPVAGAPATFTLADPKGNILFKHSQPTSPFGITHADCELASEVLEGTYTVACKVGDTESKLAVEVKKYVLPKFGVKVDFDRPFYGPGDKATVTVQANYFHGEPLADAAVEATVHTGALDRRQAPLSARTDAKGKAILTLDLPKALAGRPDLGGDARVQLVVNVTDSAGQKYTQAAERPVTTRPVRVEVIPEGGTLVLGVANTVYVLVTRADGSPVAGARLAFSSGIVDREATTDARGVAAVEVAPSMNTLSGHVRVTAGQGEELAHEPYRLTAGGVASDFLVSTDRAVYKAGDTVTLTARGGGSDPVFIDLIKDGQTLFSESVKMSNGKGKHTFDLPADLFGTLRLVAYRFDQGAVPVRKTRVLYVEPAQGLKVDVALDRKEYQPGKAARLRLRLTDANGRPVPGALSLAGVDEAVFAVLAQRPGMEQTFYNLEQELLKPVYAIYPWSPGQPAPAARLEQALFARTAATEGAAPAPPPGFPRRGGLVEDRLRGAAPAPTATHSLAATSYPDKVQEVTKARQLGLKWVGRGWVGLVLLFVLSVYALLWVYLPTGPVLIGHGVALLMLVPLAGVVFVASDYTATKQSAGGRSSAMSADTEWFRGGAAGEDRAILALALREDGARRPAPPPGPVAGMAADGAGAPPPRVRQFFPETLLWRPELITDDQGHATLTVELADSITTWRLSASAVSADGRLGAAQKPLRVFQPFFVDLDLPVALTRGDQVGVPVVVSNYLDRPQKVRLTLGKAGWFTALSPVEQTVELGPRAVVATRFDVRVKDVGQHKFLVTALGEGVSDAIERKVDVDPDGRRVERAFSGTLAKPAELTLEVPEGAIDGSVKAFVKVYPSSFSQLVEGLDNIFRMPYGCFEQTSSTTYPNVLALDYLRRHKQGAPKVEAKAKQYIHLGYQRLVTFEVKGGGFDWFGRGPANVTLTAYGLRQFQDMAKVHDVDANLIQRTRDWLLSKRNADGSWEPEAQPMHEDVLKADADQRKLASTAYVAWSVYAGGGAADKAKQTRDYLLAHAPEGIKNPHVLALVCNALLAIDPKGAEVGRCLDRLADLKTADKEGKGVSWGLPAGARTTFYGGGLGGQIETTALAALALIEGQRHPEAARGALAWLVSKKDPRGTWHSTQATVLSLKALLAGTGSVLGGDGTRAVEVKVGGHREKLVIPADQAEVLKLVDVSKHLKAGANKVTLTESSQTGAGYQVSFLYHVPEAKTPEKKGEPLRITLSYDRADLKGLVVDDTLKVTARVENATGAVAPMVMLDLPVPVGFAADAGEFARLVQGGTIARYQVQARSVLVYLLGVAPGKPLELKYSLKATMPVKVTAPAARVYEYYDPQKQGRFPGAALEVRAKE